MNTASEQIPAYNPEPHFRTVDNAPVRYLRIGIPQSVLSPPQLTELAKVIRRHSPRHALRLRSATQVEVTIFSTQQLPLSELFLDSSGHAATPHPTSPDTVRAALCVHVPGAQLSVRQLRVLAAVMHNEGLHTLRIIDSETLIIENVKHGRAAVLQLGLREAGLITR